MDAASTDTLTVSRRLAPVIAAILLALPLAACRPPDRSTGRFDLVIGSPGHTSGRFHRPRGIAWHRGLDAVFVVDWDGRIQKFTTDGRFRASWIMPEVDVGKPEDLCVATNGHILVADTHYSRVVEFSPDGKLIGSFGSYGKEPGQFIYPVGICVGRDGCLYVSEYGENDRIQKFDAAGRFLAEWGSYGAEPGQFQRPSGIDITTNNTLFVADAVNHRVQVFDDRGGLLRVIGKEGTAPGEFRYPYDVAIRRGQLYVLEYGNHRIQKLSLEGKPIDTIGRPGRTDGCFVSPWRCATVKDSIYVSDTENGRVVKLPDEF